MVARLVFRLVSKSLQSLFRDTVSQYYMELKIA